MVANAVHAFCEQLIDCKLAKQAGEIELRSIAMYWNRKRKSSHACHE